MKNSEILKEARRILWDGIGRRDATEQFLCVAISLACRNKGFTYVSERALQLRSMVETHIQGFGCVEELLRVKHNMKSEGDLYRKFTTEEIQKMRFEILDSMIQECEMKGE